MKIEGRWVDRSNEQREAVPAENVSQLAPTNTHRLPHAQEARQTALNILDARHVAPVERTASHHRGLEIAAGRSFMVELLDAEIDPQHFLAGMKTSFKLQGRLATEGVELTVTEESLRLDFWHQLKEMEEQGKILTDVTRDDSDLAA